MASTLYQLSSIVMRPCSTGDDMGLSCGGLCQPGGARQPQGGQPGGRRPGGCSQRRVEVCQRASGAWECASVPVAPRRPHLGHPLQRPRVAQAPPLQHLPQRRGRSRAIGQRQQRRGGMAASLRHARAADGGGCGMVATCMACTPTCRSGMLTLPLKLPLSTKWRTHTCGLAGEQPEQGDYAGSLASTAPLPRGALQAPTPATSEPRPHCNTVPACRLLHCCVHLHVHSQVGLPRQAAVQKQLQRFIKHWVGAVAERHLPGGCKGAEGRRAMVGMHCRDDGSGCPAVVTVLSVAHCQKEGVPDRHPCPHVQGNRNPKPEHPKPAVLPCRAPLPS